MNDLLLYPAETYEYSLLTGSLMIKMGPYAKYKCMDISMDGVGSDEIIHYF